MEAKTITLDTKPDASLHVSILRPQPEERGPMSNTLVVFLNGLVLPCAIWAETVNHLVNLRYESGQAIPAILCYDRYGQGRSDPDPTDAPNSPYGHDATAVVADLHQLLTQISRDEFSRNLDNIRLILVCNSIGCPLARLYAAKHTGGVAAYLFLDSMMANTDFVSIFPDPESPGFDESQLPGDVTVDALRHARAKFRQFFHPKVPNPERLDRRQLRELLPRADGPALPDGPGGKSALLVVVGHDWDEFAKQCEEGSLSVPKAVINEYMNPTWALYNEGLSHLVLAKTEVKIAVGCGHFIQKDDPPFVAAEINNILNALKDNGW
ncbi:Alpha/Beta hydrolase protein [Staphylotrichum tortipilum]|uniref:Alpha/Beta hydrolase protein n=1 Tax=Staphylotrichum tortipilum TaxID=2831512 RepID=A0AAN6RWY2_9PEZI|nr:Alpha/Beta hydrolase protein [Staphylotrichum longicolle]